MPREPSSPNLDLVKDSYSLVKLPCDPRTGGSFFGDNDSNLPFFSYSVKKFSKLLTWKFVTLNFLVVSSLSASF